MQEARGDAAAALLLLLYCCLTAALLQVREAARGDAAAAAKAVKHYEALLAEQVARAGATGATLSPEGEQVLSLLALLVQSYLLYNFKSTNTNAEHVASRLRCCWPRQKRRKLLRILRQRRRT